MKIASIAILNATYVSNSWAQELATGTSIGSYSWEAVKVVVSLALVLVIFYLLVNAFKKYTGVSMKANSSIRVIGGLTLGGKDKVVILEAGKVNFLLGVSNSGITKIHQFEEDEFDASNNAQVSGIGFNQHIERILNKNSS
ncbi:MAG: flagellar biosynthetic protein FliO [Gammaproteobacteria bacterium]|nr:flagellar biosynthetic protein FliO [Gammaproteobacteria bacterium]